MRIYYGERFVSLAFLPVILYFIIVLYSDEIGQVFLKGASTLNLQAGESQAGPEKIITGLTLVLSFARFRTLGPLMRGVFYSTLALVLASTLESYYKYGVPMVYPHVLSKVAVMFAGDAMYIFFKGTPKKYLLPTCIWMTFVIFVFDMVGPYRDALTVSSFLQTERGMHASNVFLATVAYFYFFNQYITTKRWHFLLGFFVIAGFVLFLNHRTVWLTSITGMALNWLLVLRQGRERIQSAAFTPLLVIPLIAGILISSYIIADNPEIVKTVVDRITDIEKVDEQGTGRWRIEQLLSYMPYVLEHPLYGMRFEGFELPVQFYAEQTGQEVFMENTGHHFHSFFMDTLFYYGLIGLAAQIIIPIAMVRMVWRSKVKISVSVIALVSWSFIALQFGLSYPWHIFHYAVMGMTLALLENDIKAQEALLAEEENYQDTTTQPADPDEGGPGPGLPAHPSPMPVLSPVRLRPAEQPAPAPAMMVTNTYTAPGIV